MQVYLCIEKEKNLLFVTSKQLNKKNVNVFDKFVFNKMNRKKREEENNLGWKKIS